MNREGLIRYAGFLPLNTAYVAAFASATIFYMGNGLFSVVGQQPSKWCAGCHDHAVFSNGRFDRPIKEQIDFNTRRRTNCSRAGISLSRPPITS